MDKSVAEMQLVVTADATRAQSELRKLGETGRQSSREIRDSMMEGRAAIKQIGEEIGINLNRHLVSFLAKLPGVAPAMAAAFPAAAVVGIGMALYAAGQRLVEFVEKNQDAAGKINEAFAAMHQTSKLATDELAVTNDKLEEQIAKLTGNRPNNLKTMLDEARASADKLVKSLDAVNKEAEKAAKENEIGFLGGNLTFQMPTTGITDVIRNQARELQEIAEKYQNLSDSAKTSAEAQKIEKDSRNELIAKERDQLKDLQDYYNYVKRESTTPGGALYGGPDRSAELGLVGGRAHQLEDMIRQQQEELRNLQDSHRIQALQQRPDWKAIWGDFYGPGKLKGEMQRVFNETHENQPDEVSDTTLGLRMQADLVDHTSERWKAYNDAVAEASQIQDRLKLSAGQAQIQLLAQTGAITEQAARVRLLQNEIRGYQSQIGDLRKQYGSVSSDAMLSDSSRMAQMQQIQNRIAELTGMAGIKEMELDAAQKATQLRNQVGDMFQEWINKATDMGAAIKRTFEQAIGTVNDAIIKSMVEPHARGTWSQAGKSIFSGVAKSGLELAEGSLMKALFGKNPNAKLGTKDNPMYTRSADAGASAGNSAGILGGIFSGGSGSGSGDSSDSSSGGGGLFGSILSSIFGGSSNGRASGGYTPAGPVLVGERGPEIWNFASAGHVTPNHRLGGQGGDVHHTWNIDARGATDPAAVHAAVRKAIAAAEPRITSRSVGLAIQSMRDYNSRVAREARI